MELGQYKTLEELAMALRTLLALENGTFGGDGAGTHFITPDGGRDTTNGVYLVYNHATNYRNGLEMVEAAVNVVHGRIQAPVVVGTSHSGSATVKTVLTYDGSGDIYIRHKYSAFPCSNSTGHSAGLQSYSAVTLANQSGTWCLCVHEYTISNLDSGDFIVITLERDATDVSDTYTGGNVWVQGFQVVF